MRRAWMILLLALGSLLVGCGSGMVDTQAQRSNRYRNELNFLARQFNDDFDYFWLADRPLELTEWKVRDAD